MGTVNPVNIFLLFHNNERKMKIAFEIVPTFKTGFIKYLYMIMVLGFNFVSETDTEVIAKMIKYMFDNNPGASFSELVEKTVKELEGKGISQNK